MACTGMVTEVERVTARVVGMAVVAVPATVTARVAGMAVVPVAAAALALVMAAERVVTTAGTVMGKTVVMMALAGMADAVLTVVGLRAPVVARWGAGRTARGKAKVMMEEAEEEEAEAAVQRAVAVAVSTV